MLSPRFVAKYLTGRARRDWDVLERLAEVVNHPTRETWDAAYEIILYTDGENDFCTLLDAVRAVDPAFVSEGKIEDFDGRVLKDWTRIPDSSTIVRALKYAKGLCIQPKKGSWTT